MHWKLLGLDRNAANKTDVKKAYAKLLRQHRPDEDPEMFQQVRQAFEQANHDLANPSDGPANITQIVGFGEPESGNGVSNEFPPASTTTRASPFVTAKYAQPNFEPAESEPWQQDLKQALTNAAPDAIQDAFRAMHQLASQRPQCWEACAQLLESLDTNARSLFAQHLPTTYLLDELQTGQRNLSSCLIQHWSRQHEFEALKSFAQQILVADHSTHGPDLGMIAAQSATLLAIVAHPLATRLSHMAYGHLDRHLRDRVMEEGEFWLHLGLLVQYQGPEFAQFWEARIREPQLDETAWSDSHSISMLNQLGLAARHAPERFEIMRRFIPPVLWGKVEQPETVKSLPVAAWQPERPIADQVWDQITSEQSSAATADQRSSQKQKEPRKSRTPSSKKQRSRRSSRSSHSQHSYDDGSGGSSKKIMWGAGFAFFVIIKILFFILRDAAY